MNGHRCRLRAGFTTVAITAFLSLALDASAAGEIEFQVVPCFRIETVLREPEGLLDNSTDSELRVLFAFLQADALP